MHRSQSRSTVTRRRLLERINLLCDSGAGIEAIASPLTHAVRDYLGCAAGSLFWIDSAGDPGGFYHDSAPAEIKDLFITQLDELFLLPGQTNMMTVMHQPGPLIGSTLLPGYHEHLWSGNVYRFLCQPLNHRWLLDMRIEIEGTRHAVYCAWQGPESPFTAADAIALQPVRRAMERAVALRRADVAWRSVNNGAAHLITDIAGAKLLAINGNAERVLMSSHLLRQRVAMTEAPRAAPGFAKILSSLVATGAEAVTRLPVTDGRIIARASRMRSVADDAEDTLTIDLDHQVPVDVERIERVLGLPLTPLQRRIALFAMSGGDRGGCCTNFDVSPEALKKHLRAIFDVTGTANWVELAAKG